MISRRASVLVLVTVMLAGSPPVQPLLAQGDPAALQKRAIERIEAFVDRVRKTGDMRSGLIELAQADAELAASNKLLVSRRDWSFLAVGLTKQGHIYRLRGLWQNAIPIYRQAEEAAKLAGSVMLQADALGWRAMAESSEGNVGQAFEDASEAVRLADKAGDVDVLARVLDTLAAIQIQELDLPGAAATAGRELEIAARAKDPMASYFAYLNRSSVYLKTAERCDYQRSFAPCYQALDLGRADLDQARAIVQKLGYTSLVRQTEEMFTGSDQRRALIQSFEKQTTTLRASPLFKPKAASDVLVTEKFIASGQPIPGWLNDVYQAGRRQQAELGRYAGLTESRAQYVDGLMSEFKGDQDAALTSYLKALETLETDRRTLRDERSRGTFLDDRVGFYYAAVRQLLERRRYADAFIVLERSRSRALADLLASRAPGLSRPEEQKLYAESELLRTRIANLQSRLFEMAGEPGAAKQADKLTALQAQIRTLEGQYQTVAVRMGAEAPRLKQLLSSSSPTLETLQASMRAERYELLQYLVLEDSVIVWHIAPDAVHVRSVFLPRTLVIDKVAVLQKGLGDRNAPFDGTIARELFLYLVSPVLSQIRAERLVVIPHEDLQYVPFQVFQNPVDGQYLGERFQITYAPSASVLLGMKRSSSLSGGHALAVVDPSITTARNEVGGAGTVFSPPGRIVRDQLALESQVKAWIRDYDVVHFAVHGTFDSEAPMLSHLKLARGEADDGQLTAAEMFGLPLDNSRLVVLSACETGRAQATHANEIMGMVRALIYAGAGTLVLSGWRVDSDAAALWMQTFYDAARTRPLPDAARAALIKVKSNPVYKHPYYWGAFTMVGR